MLYFTFLVTTFFTYISVKKVRSVQNPYFAFNILWGIVALFLIIGNAYVDRPDNRSQLIILVGVISFDLSLFSKKFVIGSLRLLNDKERVIDKQKLFVISVIVLFFSAVTMMETIRLFFSGVSLSSIRDYYYTYNTNESVIVYYIRSYFVGPVRYTVIASSLLLFFQEKRLQRSQLIITILLVAVQIVANGGRYAIINSLFMALCVFLKYKNSFVLTTKKKIWVYLIVIIGLYAAIYLTDQRATYLTRNMTTLERLYSTIYTYFAGSVTYMGKVIETYPGIIGSTHGINFVAGFISPIFALLTFLHLVSYPQIFNVIGTYTTELRIGSTWFNAMPTIFGYFYIDGGIIFTMIESFLFGYICRQVYLRSEKGDSFCNVAYILLYMQICTSSTRWFLYSPGFALAFLYIPLLLKESKVNNL